MLVPCIVFLDVLVSFHADSMSSPGAYTSTHFPKLLNLDLMSVFPMEPTEIAVVSEAGDVPFLPQASSASFPAATTTATPAATVLATALFNDSL